MCFDNSIYLFKNDLLVKLSVLIHYIVNLCWLNINLYSTLLTMLTYDVGHIVDYKFKIC